MVLACSPAVDTLRRAPLSASFKSARDARHADVAPQSRVVPIPKAALNAKNAEVERNGIPRRQRDRICGTKIPEGSRRQRYSTRRTQRR